MSFTLQNYRSLSKDLPSFFNVKKIYGGLKAEKYYYHEVMRPNNNSPKEAVAIICITTLYASRELGGWQLSGYHLYLDGNGYRIQQPYDTMRIYEKVDEWLEEIRSINMEQNIPAL
jgi:hypothetical protein